MKVDLKPKPIEKPDQTIDVPDHLDEVDKHGKPIIRLNISDYWNMFVKSIVEPVVDYAVSKIPYYVWIIIIVLTVAIIIIKVFWL